jgi:uncharacterized protein with GYD domain
MAKCMFNVSYNPEGAKGIVKEGGTRRRAFISEMVGNLGGKLECFYFAFGETDVVTIVDLPDQASIAAVALAVEAAGAARIRTTILLTPEEIDQAVKKQIHYRAPGH